MYAVSVLSMLTIESEMFHRLQPTLDAVKVYKRAIESPQPQQSLAGRPSELYWYQHLCLLDGNPIDDNRRFTINHHEICGSEGIHSRSMNPFIMACDG